MRKFFAIMLCLLSISTIISCTTDGTSDEGSYTTTVDETNSSEELFDKEMLHKPTEKDIQKIHAGMTFAEVVGIIGKPHFSPPQYSHNNFFVWVTNEGNSYRLAFSTEEKCPENMSEWDYCMNYKILIGFGLTDDKP